MHDVEVVAEIVGAGMQGAASLLATNSGGASSVTGDVGGRVGRSNFVDTKEGLR
jgi:hypothetical protein